MAAMAQGGAGSAGPDVTRQRGVHAVRRVLLCAMADTVMLIHLLRQWALRTALNAAPPLAAPQPGPRDARAGQRSPELPLHPMEGTKDERPGVRPGAFESESTYARGEPMHSVPQAAATRRPILGPAQKSALLRWHGTRGQLELMVELTHQPHFPLVNTGGTPRRPRRFTGPKKGGPGHAA